jgi:glycosyltransferase involved in cell wall biosynthesis
MGNPDGSNWAGPQPGTVNQPLISICLPSLNGRAFLKERLETIFAQTIKDWELIVCDSYSVDGSWEFFQKFKDDPRVHLHQVPREGIYPGWNECLRRANGRYVYIATSDDTMVPQCLEKLVTPLEHNPGISVAVCDYQTIDDEGRPLPMPQENSPRGFLGECLHRPCVRSRLSEFLLHCCFHTVWVTMTAVLFRRSLLERTGVFRTDVGVQADLAWALRATLLTDIAWVPGQLATWRRHSHQATPRTWYNWEFTTDTMRIFADLLNDPATGLPDAWKQVCDWQDELTRVWRWEYLDSFHLDRGALRQSPGLFLKNCWAAARHQPDLLLSQLARGFAWRPEFSPDRFAHAQRLIRLFQAPWPPEANNVASL